MKVLLPLLIIFFAPLLMHAQAVGSFAVVELFTSEGDGLCEEAGSFLKEIYKENRTDGKALFCLTYHVDYWNKLGWKDPFSRLQYTRRQENYSRVLPSHEMYTPQFVVNGTAEYTLKEKEKIKLALKSALQKAQDVTLQITLDSLHHDTAYISWSHNRPDKNLVLQIVYTENAITSRITKGENSGKTLHHDHMVKTLFAVNSPATSGQTRIILRDRKETINADIIGFLQNKQNYRILAADEISLDEEVQR